MHSGERRVHQHGGPIRGVERPKPFLTHDPPHAVQNPFVPAIPQLQPLLHHVHRRKHGVTGHGGADSRGGVRGGVVRAPLGQPLLTSLVHREIDGVGRASAQAHCTDTAVKCRRALRLENGL